MEGSSSSSKKQQATGADAACGGGGKPARRPHWRRRDPADTAVYVVQPTQFRTVVQQLTGLGHQSGGGTAPEPHQQAAAGACTNAAAQQQQGAGASSGRTLGQFRSCSRSAWPGQTPTTSFQILRIKTLGSKYPTIIRGKNI